ncbi:DUF4190 domain-containing protein [Cellulomonas hominis]|uniref:DUF4190 domain-containing protein n=1 Tax=Cellulomonas hominis TaxID=156981 RepID=UPI001B99849B|nr:DUF4190 domain-containing protein [Cellulomonas hominis]VTR75888.1 hypothetical protein CHMI_00641 [Cellulomonas hominis]
MTSDLAFPEPRPVTERATSRGVDGLAIASLAVSLCSPLTSGLAAPVGLGLGVAALRRIGRSGARGRGLAVAGIVVGSVVTLAGVALVGLFTVLAFGTASP